MSDIALNKDDKSSSRQAQWILRANDHGHFDIQIRSDGSWWHKGEPIKREGLVRLFASVLHCDHSGQHWLVTPVEKGRIDVEIAPLMVTQVDNQPNGELRIATSTLDQAAIGPEHPLAFRQVILSNQVQWLPFVLIRDNLWAHFNRPSYYELMEHVIERDDGSLAITAGDYEVSIPNDAQAPE